VLPDELVDAVCPDCSAGIAPGMPADADAPAGSELDGVVPADVDVCGAEPGLDEGEPELGRPLDWPEEDELEEEDDEEELELDELDELELGMPPDELLDDVAQPASRNAIAAASRAVLRGGTANSSAEPFIAIAPWEPGPSLSKHGILSHLPRVSPESGLGKLNAT